MSIFSALKKEIEKLPPAYFTLVMSVGIVALGAHFLKYEQLSSWLFWLSNVAFGVLIVMLVARLLLYPKSFFLDLRSFKKGAGFLSLIAAIAILGIAWVMLKQEHGVASVLFWFGAGAWVLLIYGFLMAATTKEDKPSLDKGISGVWLLMVVSTQALAILAVMLHKHLFMSQEQVMFLALCLYSLGLMLYIIIITLIFYRLTFFHAEPKAITPPYWVNEGAVGITTLAGAVFIQNISSATGFMDIIPFVKGISVLAWATATWWIPFIVLLEIWKYGIKKVSLSYTPTYWALVFCVGGYAVATHLMSKALNISFLHTVPKVFFFLALALMVLVLLGMGMSILKTVSSKPDDHK